jgi:hypothetical protein
MNEQQLAAVKLALVALEEWYFGCGAGSESHDDAVEAIKQAIAQDALDKKAENARELGLDYEPAVQPVAQPASEEDMKVYRAIADNYRKDLAAAQPAVQEGRDWSLLEATQESLREHMAEINRLQKEIIEQCRIIAMSAEREDALRAEIKRLKAAQLGVKEG